MSVRKDTKGQWHVELCVNNERIHRRLPTGSSKSDAEFLEAQLLVAVKRDSKKHIPGDPPLTQVLALYTEHSKRLRSSGTAVYQAVRIAPWCKDKLASQAKQAVDKFIADCHGSYKPSSVNRSIGVLKKALKIAWDQGIASEDFGAKIRRIPENNERIEWISPEQAALIAAKTSDRVRAAIWIALLTGCRRGEVLQIEKDDIKSDHIVIRSQTTKTLKTRIVPIVPALRPWLEFIPIGLKASGIQSGFRRAAAAVGLGHMHFHDLRHGCATTLVSLGVDLYTIQQILGHSTPRMTQRYAKMSLDVKMAALSKLGDAVKKVA